MKDEKTYTPPAGRHWLTPAYDLLSSLTGLDRHYKQPEGSKHGFVYPDSPDHYFSPWYSPKDGQGGFEIQIEISAERK
jgi:hypothetical protein